jgi:hypothetical protein
MKQKKHSEKDKTSCKNANKVWVQSTKRTPHCRGAPRKRKNQSDFEKQVVTVARDVNKDKKLPLVVAKVATLARDVEKDKSLPMMAAKVLYKDGKKVEKEKRKIDTIIKLSKKVNQRLNPKGKQVFRPLKGATGKGKKTQQLMREVRDIATVLAKRPANKDIGKLSKLLAKDKEEPEIVNVIVPRKKN